MEHAGCARFRVPTQVRVSVAILVLACFFVFVLLGNSSAHASIGTFYYDHYGTFSDIKNGSITLCYDSEHTDVGIDGSIDDNTYIYDFKGKPTGVKSSNKRVLKATALYSYKTNNYYLDIRIKGTGKATLSYKFKNKKHKVKVTVVDYQYESPVAAFKIGSKSYLSKFKVFDFNTIKKNISGKKLTVKAAPGWKVKKITYQVINSAKGTGKTIKLKSGKIIPKKYKGSKYYREIIVMCENVSGGFCKAIALSA